MTASVVDGTVVHGWCGYVEKSNEVVCKLMVINKLWIPDVLIDIIKDYLYISAEEVLRKFYRLRLNSSINDMWVNYTPLKDIYGRTRQTIYVIGHVYGGGNIQKQGIVCGTCGDFDHFHQNVSGCCPLAWDIADEQLELVENFWEGGDQEINTESEEIPEVTWDIDIPIASYDFQQAQAVLNALQQAEAEVARQQIEDAVWGREPERYDYDMESEMADYAEYHREIEMEEYEGRRSR
jgi:hypothetical protein